MQDVGRQDGCGRALWEYDNDRLNSYGTPMSLMLLPYWTDGCIASMEGLYFEASSTTPYHFLMQSELSARPSRPQRKLPYTGLDMTRGVEHLQLMGVRYYMAFSQQAVTAARANPELVEIAEVGGDPARVRQLQAAAQPDQAAIDRASPWVIFQVKDAPLVEGLNYDPVVVTNINQHQSSWLQPSADYFMDPTSWDPFPAAGGPSAWPRAALSADEPLPRSAVGQPAVVHDVKTTESTVSFTVDKASLGKPVLVKTSYFPNWHVKGGVGPYRVMPNFMVVVPTSTKVTLSYGYTPIDGIGWGLTLLSLFGLAVLFRRPALRVARLGPDRPTEEDEDEPEPPDRRDWLAAERDPTMGWLFAAPDRPLDGEPGAPPEETLQPADGHDGHDDGPHAAADAVGTDDAVGSDDALRSAVGADDLVGTAAVVRSGDLGGADDVPEPGDVVSSGDVVRSGDVVSSGDLVERGDVVGSDGGREPAGPIEPGSAGIGQRNTDSTETGPAEAGGDRTDTDSTETGPAKAGGDRTDTDSTETGLAEAGGDHTDTAPTDAGSAGSGHDTGPTEADPRGPGWGTLADGTPIDATRWRQGSGPGGEDVHWIDRDQVDDPKE
jgi:hypothetical protein